MFSVHDQINLLNATSYYNSQFASDDYHNRDRLVTGVWMGAGAELLGLKPGDKVQRHLFVALCKNRHPGTGEQLTARMNKNGHRRVCYDWVVSAPKSLSVLTCLMGVRELQKAHEEAANFAFQMLEEYADVRRGKLGKRSKYIRSSNVIAAVFQHNTSRANDPHTHTHYVVFNATHDKEQNRWKALSAFSQYKAKSYFTAVYRKRLKELITKLGYVVASRGATPDDPTRFEIAGVPPEVLTHYSQRTTRFEEEWTEELKRKEKPYREPTKKEAREWLRRNRPKKSTLSPFEIEMEQARRLSSQHRAILEEVVQQAKERCGNNGDEGLNATSVSVANPPADRVA